MGSYTWRYSGLGFGVYRVRFKGLKGFLGFRVVISGGMGFL